jgi:hypothetical protein
MEINLSDPCKYVGVSGEQCEKVHDLLSQCGVRRKRLPSQYNMYVKACLQAKGGVKKFGQAGQLMRQCATEYKEDKSKGKFRYEFEMPVSPQQPQKTLWKGRDIQAEWNELYKSISGRKK